MKSLVTEESYFTELVKRDERGTRSMSVEADGAPVERKAGDPASPCVMVIFGAAGDLTKRKLIPALYNLAKEKLLAPEFAIVGLRGAR